MLATETALSHSRISYKELGKRLPVGVFLEVHAVPESRGAASASYKGTPTTIGDAMTFRERDREAASNDAGHVVPTALMTEEEPGSAALTTEDEPEEPPVRE